MFLSIYPSIPVCSYLSIYISPFIFIYLSIYISLFLYIYPYLSLSFSLSLSLSYIYIYIKSDYIYLSLSKSNFQIYSTVFLCHPGIKVNNKALLGLLLLTSILTGYLLWFCVKFKLCLFFERMPHGIMVNELVQQIIFSFILTVCLIFQIHFCIVYNWRL